MSLIRILGAGVMGLALATELTARGHAIELIDPHEDLGPHGCSWWAGGMLAPFCEAVSAGPPAIDQGVGALNWWQDNTGVVQRNGTLVVALSRDNQEISRFARRSQNHHLLNDEHITELEPDLAGRFSSGLFFPEEGHLAPREALATLRRRLLERGIHIRPIASDALADLTFDARGLTAGDELKDLRGVRGEMLILSCPEVHLSRPIRLLHPRFPLYIVPRGNGIFMLGATSIESARRGPVTVRSTLELLSAALALHPAFGEAAIIEAGADARPAFPDNLPKLRRRGKTIFANGLYRHGFLLSPAMAKMAADHIETGVIPAFMDDVA